MGSEGKARFKGPNKCNLSRGREVVSLAQKMGRGAAGSKVNLRSKWRGQLKAWAWNHCGDSPKRSPGRR